MNDYSKYRDTALPYEEWEVPGPVTDGLLDTLLCIRCEKDMGIKFKRHGQNRKTNIPKILRKGRTKQFGNAIFPEKIF